MLLMTYKLAEFVETQKVNYIIAVLTENDALDGKYKISSPNHF